MLSKIVPLDEQDPVRQPQEIIEIMITNSPISLKKAVFTLSAIGCFGTAHAVTAFNATGTAFLTVPDVSSTDLANGIAPSFLFFGGNENVSNGNVGNLTNGAQGSGQGFNGGSANVGNGPGIALYTIDLGSPQFIDSVNIFSSGGGADSNRQDQTFTIYGHNDALAFDPSFMFTGDDIVFNVASLDGIPAFLDAITTSLTVIGSVDEQHTLLTDTFGASTIAAGDQQFQFISIAADAQGTAGGGESTIFTEFDVIQGVPEPSSALLLGLTGMAFLVRRRK